jgi:superfamily II DNA or RNA helicase
MTKKEESRQLIKSNTEKLFNDLPSILMLLATGVGKSFLSINLQSKLDNPKTFVVVAEIAHIQNWKDEYIKHGYEYLLEKTEIFCYASLKKYANKSCDLLILDEAHHISNDREYILSTIKANYVIGLSATMDNNDKEVFSRVAGKFHTYEISMEEAIEMELLPKPKVYLIPLQLDNSKKSEIIEFKRGRNINEIHCDYLQRNAYIYAKNKYPTLNLIIHCTQLEKYNYIDAEYNKAAMYKRTGWLRYGGIRKKYLSDCKTNKIKELCQVLESDNKRFICFCGSIEQAELIGSNNCIHSKKEVKNVINKFQLKQINSLYAIKMMTEGVNLTDIEVAIIGQLDGTERPFVQRSGRGLRAEFPEIYVLYFKNTKDEDYLQNVINTISQEYINYL